MIRILTIVLIILAIAFLVGGGYFLGLQGSKNTPSVIQTSTPTTDTSATPSATVVPTSTASPTPKPVTNTLQLIENGFVSGNFDILKPNLAAKVMLITYATSCCGETDDYKKVSEFIANFAKDYKDLKYNPTDEKYSGLKKSSDWYVVAGDGRAISFKLDSDKKLRTITSFGDYRLAE